MRNFVTIYKRLERIDQLIKFRRTGTAKELSERLGISERAVFYHFSILKIFGYSIEFSYYFNTYYYTQSGQFITNEKKQNELYLESL